MIQAAPLRALPLAGLLPLLLPLLGASCAAVPPLPGVVPADELIQPGELRFRRLWRLTRGGENAEGYWSFAGDRLVLQRRNRDEGVDCDRIYVTGADGLEQVSSGRGTTTCGYFLPGDREVVFASTQEHAEACPPPLDYSQGYVWKVHPEHDLWVHDLESGAERRLTTEWGYDAEATVSPLGDRIVFTSTRSGDLEIWTMDLDGSNPVQVTDEPGYDGGAFFSHDGQRLVFRTTGFTPGAERQELATYRELLADWKVRPHSMDIMLVDADGANRRRLTDLGGASFAPYFYPDDRRVIFSSNWRDAKGRDFDLWAVGVDGERLERITTYEGFDSFPMFSPDGRWLVFASNRGGLVAGETNLYLAEWR